MTSMSLVTQSILPGFEQKQKEVRGLFNRYVTVSSVLLGVFVRVHVKSAQSQ